MEIRTIARKDIYDCARSFTLACKHLDWTQGDAVKYLATFISAPTFIGYMLLEKDQVYAALFASVKTIAESKQLVIDELYVLPQKLGMGYGKRLLEHVEMYARQGNVNAILMKANCFLSLVYAGNVKKRDVTKSHVLMFKKL